MGWKNWREVEEGSNSSERSTMKGSLGFGGIEKFGNPGSEDRCSNRRIIKSHCKTEEIEPGRFVRKCEKEEQVLRECLGRPVEVLESNTEYTEDDVTDQVMGGRSRHHESSGSFEPFNFPGLRDDFEFLERNLFGGLNRFLEAAEEMSNGFFQSFDTSQYNRESRNPSKSVDGFEKDASSQTNESAYADFTGQLRDV